MIQRALKKYRRFISMYFECPKGKITGRLQLKRCVTIYLIANREYTYRLSGRCTSFRSRGKISNFVIRNYSYGIEQRIFVNNPRLDIYT